MPDDDAQLTPGEKPPYEEWPKKAQMHFELYYSLKDRRLSVLAQHPECKARLRSLQAMSADYGWVAEVARRDAETALMQRQAAEEQRRAQNQQRLTILENADSGMGNLLTAYALAASGTCPQCRGAGRIARPGKQDTTDCPVCGGDGVFLVMKVNAKAFVATYRELNATWAHLRAGGDEVEAGDSSVSPEEQRRLGMSMMQDAGLDAYLRGDLTEDDGFMGDVE